MLLPGEVLAVRFTDVGWTPYFAVAAAVVVDVGGQMSHEFGIPCVVDTGDGSERLRTGSACGSMEPLATSWPWTEPQRKKDLMRVLVTGATGVFGRALCERLSGRGDHVVAMARRAPERPIAAAEFRAGDVRDSSAVKDAVAGCEAVAHLAWAFAPLETRAATEELDVGGTRNVVEAMTATGCRRLVFSSSVLAYGAIPRGGRLLDEDEPLCPDPDHLYGTHKRMAEDVMFSADIDAVAVRAGVTAGRSSYDNTIHRFLSGPVLIDASDGDRAWQLVHPDDVGRPCAGSAPSCSRKRCQRARRRR
ncbi:MAG: galE4 [Pseudonocardia sp.]|nr:galE4 [Pseudonocardia sp.]